MKKLSNFLSSMPFALFLLMIFATAIGVATFIENDFGTETTQVEVYRAKWFEFLLFLGTLNLILVAIRFKLYLFKKWYVSLFHFSIVIIMFGAFATRYFGFEGTMHIREGMSSNEILSEQNFIKIGIDGKTELFPKQFSNMSENEFSEKVGDFQITLKNYVPYVKTEKVESENGRGEISAVVSIDTELEPIQLELNEGELEDFGFTVLDFGTGYISETPHQQKIVKIEKRDDKLFLVFDGEIGTLSMDTNERKTFQSETEILSRHLYTIGETSIVFKELHFGIEKKLVSQIAQPTAQRESFPSLFEFEIKNGDEVGKLEVFGKAGSTGMQKSITLRGKNISISYGAEKIPLSFSILLRKFELERYAGSMSPSSYASEVTLQDGNFSEEYRIYMNHVLDYKGFRFFQSSYDPDEMGTVLSVNYDPIGTPITYFGYFLLFLGLTVALFGKKSRFRKLAKNVTPILILALPISGYSEKIEIEDLNTIFKFDREHSNNFGSLLVVDSSGRMKPLDSLNMEIVRKISRQTKIENLNHNQIVLGMIIKPNLWKQINMVYTKDPKINEIIGAEKEQKRVPFELFFEDPQTLGGYKLSKYVSEALQVPQKKRGLFEKNILKIDERVNIAYMVYSGQLLQIYPFPKSGEKWVSTVEALQTFPEEDAQIVRAMSILYFTALDNSLKSGNWTEADKNLDLIRQFQQGHGSSIYLERNRIEAEILYNKLEIFQKLIPYTLVLGFVTLVLAFWQLLSSRELKIPVMLSKSATYLIFIFFTVGLALRWYISGHAPWSDAYESLVYIGWATLLAGMIFSRNSLFTLSATLILSGIILFVANLSWLDPQITNLVPVLKSYWLTIHVSMITASYGFLGLGALLGFITLTLFVIPSENRKESFKNAILNLNRVNEMNLIVGLVLLTIGNFLGGVWANESWGRYWGWDPKETWALVTILVYTVVLHVRFIPKVNMNYFLPFLSTVAFSSVIMTYFGVNFYLSGLHSYAQGDPIPVPQFVYWTIGVVAIISILSWRKREIAN
ncbi:ABC-type transport system involved in cytochrome c biogenesis, permease component [Thiovulum sp. ES]|nr:ABC-type transport system involved in cytochrome c biogenesis, permease component [Thiovulum sp. ES]